MNMLDLNGGDTRLYMRYERAWPKAAQGMAIWGDRAYILYDSGVCAIYDLVKKDGKILDVFKLGSYCEPDPKTPFYNHANDAMFSRTHWQGNPIPLLYVTIGSGIDYDDDGYYYRVAVEDIRLGSDGKHTARQLQTISYKPQGIEQTRWLQPCWGCPNWMMDPDTDSLYMFSAKYRTKRGCVPEGEQNTYIITRFPLPKVEESSFVTLTPGDILDQFTVDSDVPFTQGGTIVNGKLYYTFGCPKSVGKYPDRVMVFDLEKKCLCAQVNNMDEAMNMEEIECAAPYDGKLLVNTNGGFGIYVVKEDLFLL